MLRFAFLGRALDLVTITFVVLTNPAAMAREANVVNAAAWHAGGLAAIALYWAATTALLVTAVRIGQLWRGAHSYWPLLAFAAIPWAGPVANLGGLVR